MESLVSDIPVGDGKLDNLFLQGDLCTNSAILVIMKNRKWLCWQSLGLLYLSIGIGGNNVPKTYMLLILKKYRYDCMLSLPTKLTK